MTGKIKGPVTVTQRKTVEILVPNDVQLILPLSALEASSKRGQTSDPRKALSNGGRRTSRLGPIQENGGGYESDSNSASNRFPDGSKKDNELFEEGDVEGERLFSFTPSTPKNRKACTSSIRKSATRSATKMCTPNQKTPTPGKKAAQTPSTLHRTPKSSRKRLYAEPEKVDEKVDKKATSSEHETYTPQTPYGLRTRMKQMIHKEVESMELEDSGSEFSFSDSDDDTDESSDSSSSNDESSEVQKPILPAPSTRARKSARGEIDYVCSHKDYFHMRSSKKKDKTSNNLLNQLKNPNLTHTQFRNILKQLSQSHKKDIQTLHQDMQSQFHHWMFYLSQNFSVILYGLGSKRKILEDFRKMMLSESKVLVVNGFFPTVSLKEILDSIMKQLLNMKEAAPNTNMAVEMIRQRLKPKSAPHIFIIINNIDGSCLRDEKCQSALCSLVSHEKIHLIASIDHLNAPLIWDVAKLGNLSPVWIEATTFLPYIDEVSFENSFLVKHTGSSMALSSLVNVYKSLTSNAKKVYRILVEDHLDNSKNKNYPGMSFVQLYDTAKRDFIVSSDLSLRTLLTEFVDHELVKWRRDNEHLTIPVEGSVLKKFMEMHGNQSD
ncbi:unnamed protein product [Bemisia tabaci]|uniref:Origin recognition complex subunit 2 n=1 Tax=Bemisia tabaci TaxID=7038 RepID=A0A9P0AB09_BEMTA|nr:unnamed protein product [Bemisia tabaci]